MRNQGLFRLIFGTLGILIFLVRLFYMRRGSESGARTSKTRGESCRMPLLSIFGLLGWLVGLVYIVAPQRVKWVALPFPTWSRWIGACLGIISLPLFAWTHHTLGKNWSVALLTKEGHTLVANGPYRWVRHPMYTTIFLQALAFFLLSANWIIGMTGLGTSILCVARVGDEEALMIEEFGDQYRAYMQRTGRFLPRIRAEARLRGTP